MPSQPVVVTVGHAIVDVLSRVADEVVAGFGLGKGTMTLVDDERSMAMYRSFVATTEMSGGSAANTAVGLASLGTPAAFVGKVRDDDFGRVFTEDIRAAGVGFDVPSAGASAGDMGTGRCMIMVTPDAEKTMCTYLGIGDYVEPDDVDASLVEAARVVYLEGYLCGLPHTDPTVERVVSAARAAGVVVALSLSDPYWVALHGSELDALLDRVDLLFGNEDEALGMVPGAATCHDAALALAKRCGTVVVTRGASGAVVVGDGGSEVVEVAAAPVSSVVDTTGAGDLFAAGYLHGFVEGFEPARCARLGGLAAAEVISHLGARPQIALASLVERSG